MGKLLPGGFRNFPSSSVAGKHAAVFPALRRAAQALPRCLAAVSLAPLPRTGPPFSPLPLRGDKYPETLL